MKKWIMLGLLVCVSGCKTIDQAVEWWESQKPPVVDPTPTPEPPAPAPVPGNMPDASKPGNYRAGFLWKPIGDGDRPAVALLPTAFTHKTTRRMEMLRGGSVVETASRAHNDAVQPNGNREHYRFSRKGGEYPGQIALRIETQDGTKWTWTVPNPGERYDGKITPTVGNQPVPEPTPTPTPSDPFRYEPGENSVRIHVPAHMQAWKMHVFSRRRHFTLYGPASGPGPYTVPMGGAALGAASKAAGDDGTLLVFVNTAQAQTGDAKNAGWRIMDPTKAVTGDATRLKAGENR